MKISTVEIFVNNSDDVCPPKSIPGCVHVIPGTFQIFKVTFDSLVISACLRIARLIDIIIICCRLPNSSDDILGRAVTLVQELNKIGIPTASIYVDPLIQPISVESTKGIMVFDAVRTIKAQFPDVHITGGLSNISYELPQRQIINRTFVTLMMDAGINSAIIDPLEKK